MSELLSDVRRWLEQDSDPDTRAELSALLEASDLDELGERFSGRLLFGTAGIRGVLGAGPMRMNQVVVAQVSAGLADYVLAHVDNARKRGIVIGYDARNKSRQFAEEAARIFLGKGIEVHLFQSCVPTPTTAFAVKDVGAAAGVMVTASHNPPDYNGYKVYWENGAQIIPPLDGGIQECIEKVSDVRTLERKDLEAARAGGQLHDLGAAMEEKYLDGVLALRLHPDVGNRDSLVIAYTPLHGVGGRFIDEVLRRAGYASFHMEPSQAEPDGDFPTVSFPNPEEPGAMDRVMALGTRVGADLVIANDPDTDRLAVAIPEGDGYQMLTGDQVGVLLADYLLTEGPKDRRLVATTIVSSQLLGVMAKELGVDFRRTLTGFKWIANTAIDHKREHGSRLVMGYEEALGYTVGELVRDKDGVSATLLFCELAAIARERGQSVKSRLADLYRRFGVYVTRQVSLTLPGTEGLKRIAAMMAAQRSAPPSRIGGYPVASYDDLNDVEEGQPAADVLSFQLEGGARVLLRPSGTEPKLKSYYEIREPVADGEALEDALARAEVKLDALANAHQAMLAELG